MYGRGLALAMLGIAFIACDVSSAADTTVASASPTVAAAVAVGSKPPASSGPTSVNTAPTVPPPVTAGPAAVAPPAAPAPVARVTVLPGSSGKIGSAFLLQLTGFPTGPFTTTITNPSGIPKNQLGQVGPDGTASVTFSTTTQDLVGRYTFRFEARSTVLTTAIDVTR